jgi:lysyl endopeptidase
MNISARLHKAILAVAFAAGSLLATAGANAQSMPSVEGPTHAKAFVVGSLRVAQAPATLVALPAPETATIDKMKRDNSATLTKRLQIGIDRPVSGANAQSAALDWTPTEGGWVAHWTVSSEGAAALRVAIVAPAPVPSLEMRFTGSADGDTVYGPFTMRDLIAAGAKFWSPVLEGGSATVELFVAGRDSPQAVSLAIDTVAHLVASPGAANVESLLKAAGACEVNLICRSASDAALARTGNATARMTFDSGGQTFLCTGTLLNSGASSFIPYFYTASHCISTQAEASTLTTLWFFDSTTCAGNTPNPGQQQLAGGSTLLFSDDELDGTLVRLNQSPPSGAVFSGWDAATIPVGTALTAVHHPQGDVKKVSLGTMGGYTVPSDRSTPFIQSNWNSLATGVTEGGSSGSGIFTSSGIDYRLRGGLLGGPSSCTATADVRFDWYSRLDLVYPHIAQFLSPAQPNHTALWWNPNESGWGINVEQQGDIVFATLFTYDENGSSLWLVMSSGNRQGTSETFSGDLFRTQGTPFDQTFTGFTPTRVGSMSLTFTGDSAATLTYTFEGVTVTKQITKQLFGANGAAVCTFTTGSRAGATNFTDLWWNPSEAGWGINLTQQSNIMFATLFVYGSNGHTQWYVMSAGQRQNDGSFTGALFQTQGPHFNSQPFPLPQVTQVGNMTLRFSNGENGTLSYTVNGTGVTKQITRQVFSSPVPICSG